MRISTGLALIGAVVAEFVAGTGGTQAGLAYLILQAGYNLDIPRMFAALWLITFTGISLFALMVWLSDLVLRDWHESALRAVSYTHTTLPMNREVGIRVGAVRPHTRKDASVYVGVLFLCHKRNVVQESWGAVWGGTLGLRAEIDIDFVKSIIQADGVVKVSFSSIPTGAEVFVNGQTVSLCDDGIFEFSSDVVGSHTITIKKVEFLDYQVIINAV